eukprot:COSAG02_NODE_643_length_19037_cov_9.951632_17_plen_92_part_00
MQCAGLYYVSGLLAGVRARGRVGIPNCIFSVSTELYRTAYMCVMYVLWSTFRVQYRTRSIKSRILWMKISDIKPSGMRYYMSYNIEWEMMR